MIAKVARIAGRVLAVSILLGAVVGFLAAAIAHNGILDTAIGLGAIGIFVWSVHTVVWWLCE